MSPRAALIRLVDLWSARRLRPRNRRSGRARGVLLVSAGGLGDTVLFSLVAPRFLDLAEDGESVTVLLRSDAAPMAFLLPPGVRVETVDFGRLGRNPAYRLGVFRRLFEAHFRLVVSTDYRRHPGLDEALVKACRAAESVAMEPRPWPKHDRRLARNRVLYERLFDSGSEVRDKVLRWTEFANWLTGANHPAPKVRLPDTDLPPPAALDAPTVLIQPFSAVRAKQSPVALYETIIDALPASYRVRVTGAPGDLDRNPEFRTLLDDPRVTFDSSTFADLVPVLRAASLVITVDTALMHLAVAAGAPTLCLASAAYVGEIVPYAPETIPENVAFVWHDMPCKGCLGVCVHPLEDAMYPCIARLDQGIIATRARELLNRGREEAP